MFNCQVTEFQQNSRRRRACVQMFSKQTISIFSHNIRCNTLWKTTLAAWKTIHTWTSMLLLLSISKLSQIKWPDQQRFAKISLFSSVLVAPVSRHQLVCKSSQVQYIWRMGTGLRSPDLTCQPIKLAPGLQGNSKPLKPNGHSWPCDLFKTRYAPQVWIQSFEICYLDLPRWPLNWDLCGHCCFHFMQNKIITPVAKQDHLRMNNSTGSNNHLRSIDLFRSMIRSYRTID